MTAALRSAEQLKALAESGAAELGWDAPAREVIAWAVRNFELPAVAVACSMADAVLPALIADQLPGVDVLFLETGYHFPETYATWRALEELNLAPQLAFEALFIRIGREL